MSLLAAGYLPTAYIPENYITDDYIPDYGYVETSNTPSNRIFSVPTESRVFGVAEENRTLLV